MTIGEKIKKLRTDKLMSQNELAGSEITRNMLSQIEHGSAMPSLSTIKYIASRLNVSPGFLLADDEDERLYLKGAVIDNIKKAYVSKHFALCYDMCKNLEWSDEEITLILAESSLRVGIDEFRGGNLRLASQYLDEAVSLCEQSIYNTDIIAAEAASYFSYIELVSPSITSSSFDELQDNTVLLKNEFSVYSEIMCEAEQGGWDEISHLYERVSLLNEESSYLLHVRARSAMNNGDYAGAHEMLRELLYTEKYDIPQPMLYFVLGDIELCCKEIDDFKGAYEYSASKMSLLQKLIS